MEKMDGKTMDIVAENVGKLKELFPEAFTEGKVDFEAFKEVLGTFVDDRDERYSFTWNGKSKARMIAQTPSTGTLRPCKEESVDWDSTQNIFIEGDNLEVLKLLQKSYHKKVKMIYIDPPYNTGNDFVYKDNFKDNIKNYKEITGQVDGEGRNLSNNPETSGRYHTDWLNMMYPRLKLARNLLKDDGVIFISIDDGEVDNLKKICSEIFGEENFVGCAGRITKKSNNKGDYWAPNFDYLLTYTKNIEAAESFFGGVNTDAYNLVDTEGERAGEKYQLVRLYMSTIQNRNPEQRFWIECPDGQKVIPPGKTFPPERPSLGDGIWRWTRKKLEAEKEKIVVKSVSSSNLVTEDGSPARWNVFTKTYLQDVIDNSSAKPNSFIEGHINQKGSHELRALKIPFDYSKPSTLIGYLMEISKVKDDDIVLDYFAGSATTAHAVMKLNVEDNGNRKVIMVQLPEATDEKSEAYKAGYKTIAEISKERIRRAATKIKEENPDYDGDLGFKVFKLDSTNIKPWEVDFDLTERTLEDFISNIKPDRREEDVLYEILLKYGLDLTLPIDEWIMDNGKLIMKEKSNSQLSTVNSQLVYSIGRGALIICLSDDISLEVVQGIAKLKDKLNPEIMRVVFKDSGFKDDVVKTNAVQILKQAGIVDVRSL